MMLIAGLATYASFWLMIQMVRLTIYGVEDRRPFLALVSAILFLVFWAMSGLTTGVLVDAIR